GSVVGQHAELGAAFSDKRALDGGLAGTCDFPDGAVVQPRGRWPARCTRPARQRPRLVGHANNLGEDIMILTRRTLLLAGIASQWAGPLARAQSWPSGPLRIVVAYPPGGSTDAIMRLVQPGLQQRLGATVVIENRSGASGSVGTAAVVKSPPD